MSGCPWVPNLPLKENVNTLCHTRITDPECMVRTFTHEEPSSFETLGSRFSALVVPNRDSGQTESPSSLWLLWSDQKSGFSGTESPDPDPRESQICLLGWLQSSMDYIDDSRLLWTKAKNHRVRWGVHKGRHWWSGGGEFFISWPTCWSIFSLDGKAGTFFSLDFVWGLLKIINGFYLNCIIKLCISILGHPSPTLWAHGIV